MIPTLFPSLPPHPLPLLPSLFLLPSLTVFLSPPSSCPTFPLLLSVFFPFHFPFSFPAFLPSLPLSLSPFLPFLPFHFPPSLLPPFLSSLFPSSLFFSHYKIVVVLNDASDIDTRTFVPDNMLRPYDNDNQRFYAAASIDVGDYQRTFIIGDGQIYTHNNVQFMNSALRANQDYVFFVRLYSNISVSYMYNEEGDGREDGKMEEGRKRGRREGEV